MADDKITALPAAISVATTDLLVVDDTVTTRKATVAQARAAMLPVALSTEVSGSLPLTNIAPSGVNGQVVTTVGGVTTWAAVPVPTGTGFYHVTGGAMDPAATSLTWTGDATGTGTGVSFSLTVVKINGASVPAGGGLTTGNGLYVTGAATLAYSALNLAGGGTYVTGVLPTANQASQTMAGDVTGTTAASVVAKINGASVIAAGALTTGHVLKVTSVSSTTYGFVADANVASGAAIAASKVVQATGTGFPHVTSGVLDAASIKVDVTNSAHVTVPATANGVVTSSGSVLQQAANVLAGSGFISIGATPSATGDFRMQGVSAIKAIRAGTDYNVLNISLGSFIDIGDSAGSEFISARPGAGGIFRVLSGAAAFEAFTVTETQVQAGYPIVGTINNTSPYSVHAKTTVSTAGTHTMTATEYSPDAIMFSASTGGTYTFPLPASDAGAYYKTIINSGNSTVTVTNGGGAPKNVSVATNTTMRCLFDTAGVHPLSGSAGAYP